MLYWWSSCYTEGNISREKHGFLSIAFIAPIPLACQAHSSFWAFANALLLARSAGSPNGLECKYHESRDFISLLHSCIPSIVQTQEWWWLKNNCRQRRLFLPSLCITRVRQLAWVIGNGWLKLDLSGPLSWDFWLLSEGVRVMGGMRDFGTHYV